MHPQNLTENASTRTLQPLMAHASVAASPKFRRPKAFAIRSFPPLCGPATAATAPPHSADNIISDQKAPPASLITPPPEPTSCGPGNDFPSYRGKILKRPIAFAIRTFPKGCGPLAASISKPSKKASVDIVRRIPEEGIDKSNVEKPNRNSYQMPDFIEGGRSFCRPEGYEVAKREDELNDVVRRIPEEGSGLIKVLENAVVGKSFGGKDGEKPNKKRSFIPDFVKDDGRFCSPTGSVAKNKVKEMEEKLNDVVRRITEEGIGLGKFSENVVIRKSLDGKDGKQPDGKSSSMPYFVKDGRRFFRPKGPEGKNKLEEMDGELNDAVRRIPKEGSGLGKILGNAAVGKSSGKKDGEKSNRKRSLMPDLVEGGTSQGGQLLEVRGDRLIVLALMAAKRCPWMQGKVRGSIGLLQHRPKKPRMRASGNS